MDSSDDEGEAVPHTVSNYYFVDDKDEPVSFSELPIQWNDMEGQDGRRKQIFLDGTIDNGLQKIYKQVTAWKFELSYAKPQMLVLSKESNWIKLEKPRKSFEDMIRTILITVHCLHSVKKNPEVSGRSLWDHLSKVFSLNETRPSENDLIDHINIIREAIEKDETLAKSKFLVAFLEEKPQKKKAFNEDIGASKKLEFIVGDDMIDDFDEDDGSDEEDDLFDSVCAICDNGGDILCCEGRCMRSFHATVEAGSYSTCESLGLSNEQVDAIQNFFCKNCQYKQHQCFFCGELGSSDKLSGTEVFPCVSATCGRFYHPRCVAKLLHRESAAEAEEIQKKIAAGESFTCPVHKCIVCKQGENKVDPDLQFAVCRRCPKSYHRKCLPRKIAFEDVEDEGIIQRAWEGLIPNRILIYCLKQDIDDVLGTPVRNHIKFPDDGQKKKKQVSEQLPRKEKVLPKKRTLDSALGKLQKGVDLSSAKAEDGSSKKSVRRLTVPDSLKKQKVGDTSVKPLNNSNSAKVTKSTDENRASLGERLYNFMSKGAVSVKSRKEDTPDNEYNQTPTNKPVAKENSDSLSLDEDSKRRILALVKDAGSSITLEKISEKHKMPLTHANSSNYIVEKALTLGKVEVSVQAIRAALEKLEGGGNVEDAKDVCGPDLLNQIIKWKSKLRIYLAPFLFGMRYTSFGRHFTKVDKFKEIVDLLHCYVQDGDMIVDFCCGSNDFSLLMKEKLDEIGTTCSYKNYDLLQAKNDFNFEKRDWMTVHPKELPTGSKLIMGINPPFGKHTSLANKFIDKALEFKPKLLILIVPPNTDRLDKKDPPYDLIWEDDELLVGKSFYLPGSVDVNDNQLEDWNKITPPLSLWSRPDWTAKHRAIAQRHGHLARIKERLNLEPQHGTLVSDNPVEVHGHNGQVPMSMDDHPVQKEASEQLQERDKGKEKEKKKKEKGEGEVHENTSHVKDHLNEDSKKRRHDKGEPVRELSEPSPEFEERKRSPLSEMYDKLPRLSPPIFNRGRSLGGRLSEPLKSPSHPDFGHYQTGYDEDRADDIARRYGLNHEEPYPVGTHHRWSSIASPNHGPDYGARNSVEQFPGYQREITERSHITDFEEGYSTESAIRSQIRLYGQQQHHQHQHQHHPDTFGQSSSGYLGGRDIGFLSSPHRQLGPTVDPSYDRMNTMSATQRYVPRLDELNHTTRMNPLASMPPPLTAQRPRYQRVDSMSFAPGSYRPFSQNNSSGWLDD